MDGAKTERAKKKAASDGQRKHGCYLFGAGSSSADVWPDYAFSPPATLMLITMIMTAFITSKNR